MLSKKYLNFYAANSVKNLTFNLDEENYNLFALSIRIPQVWRFYICYFGH